MTADRFDGACEHVCGAYVRATAEAPDDDAPRHRRQFWIQLRDLSVDGEPDVGVNLSCKDGLSGRRLVGWRVVRVDRLLGRVGSVTSVLNGYCEVAGGRIYYEVEGEGEPVLFIHAGVANLRMWDQQAAALGGRYRVIRFDTRGYGRTESEDVEFSNRADAAAVLDEVGEVSAHIVGLSAVATALDFALEYPARTLSLAVAAGGVRVRVTIHIDHRLG